MLTKEMTPFLQRVKKVDTIWVASLNNGETIYQDDMLPGNDSAWVRMREYCQENVLYLVDLELRFRHFVKKQPSNAEGYFFCKSLLGAMFSSHLLNYYSVGYVKDGKIWSQKWKVPELVLEMEHERDITDTIPEALIMRINDGQEQE